MGKGRAPSSFEIYQIKEMEHRYDSSDRFFDSLGENLEERRQNFISHLDEKIEEDIKNGR